MKDDGHQWLVEDAPFRHAMILLVSAYKEHSQERHLSASTYMQHRTTLALLYARLSGEPEQFLIDTTIFIINILATIAIWLGRHDEIGAHAIGLKHIIGLRGGKKFLRERPFVKYHLQW